MTRAIPNHVTVTPRDKRGKALIKEHGAIWRVIGFTPDWGNAWGKNEGPHLRVEPLETPNPGNRHTRWIHATTFGPRFRPAP